MPNVLRMADHGKTEAIAGQRFDRLLVTNVYGEPLEPRTWSGAPHNLAAALTRCGVEVQGYTPRLGRLSKLPLALRHLLGGFGRLARGEQLLRGEPSRRMMARRVAAAAARMGARHVLHTISFDLPLERPRDGVRHYLYCDQTWDLSTRLRPDLNDYSSRALDLFDRLEGQVLNACDHIFTFGGYVRDNIVEHYGVPAERVTAVGSGMGMIAPYLGPKTYGNPSLLFVAKHLFHDKGGAHLVAAFLIAVQRRPDLTLTVVGDPQTAKYLPPHPNIAFRAYVPWNELQSLYQAATLLVQPMLNDPWGQVYLEALVSRTPVLGLRRNGLPEIIGDGKFGFLVDEPTPEGLAAAILEALSDPDRLAEMGRSGQRHVTGTYSWDAVARRILFPETAVGTPSSPLPQGTADPAAGNSV